MKAPDKIYLQRNTTTDLYDEFWPEWFEGTHHPDSDICYIRKDAMIEWAKKQTAWLKQGYKKEFKNDDTLNGGRLMLDKLIKKLSSM